ncbi:MAG: ATP-binding protein [Anaerolineales bacterium]|nr:ATP-binding protein [Anaerolineales bacterium]
MNLVLNALDAVADTPEPVITLRTRRGDKWCTIDIIDNGCGIPQEKLQDIFEPFFTTKPIGAGTGLGLSISQSLIREQGGTIEVVSQLDAGTTFTIRIPAANTHSDASDTAGSGPSRRTS